MTHDTTLPALQSFVADRVEHQPALAVIALIALTLLTHSLILVTPGFFSGDEWQRFDHVHRLGYWSFARTYGALRPGPEFGYPVRPIGFLQQGVAALWMQSAPWASHLVGVLNHALVALAFVWVLRRACVPAATAALAGVLFIVSPLTTMATGWIAASFDQLYVLFLLLAAAVIVRLPAAGVSLRDAVFVVLATVGALLSKETAIVAPGVVLLLGYLAWATNPAQFSWRPFAAALALVLIPLAAYLYFRAPAIAASIAGNATEAYTPALANIPRNALRFFAFPFRLRLFEMSDAVFRSPWQPAAAVLVHGLLVGAVYRLFGAAFAIAYLAGYFMFEAPILALPNPGPHYLYGAGLAMSLALAAVLVRLLTERRRRLGMLVGLGAVALVAHDLTMQLRLYESGLCQSQFLDSVDALLARDQGAGAGTLLLVPEPGAPLRSTVPAVANRERYTANGVPRVAFDVTGTTPAAPGRPTTRAYLTAACTLVPESTAASE